MGLPVAKNVTLSEVPIIDVSAMRGGSMDQRKELARLIAETCADLGFFYISNHGIPQKDIATMFTSAKQFFDLPAESLAEVRMSKATQYRGHIPIKTMSKKPEFKATAAELKGNLYEAFQIHAEFPLDDPDVIAGKPLHTQNVWPSAMPSLKHDMLHYFDELTAFAHEFLKIFALGLELPETGFDKFFQKPMQQMRFIHYPPQPADDAGENMGLRPHTDSGAFTILVQDSIGGLEILPRGQDWIKVPPIEGTYVINIGEMMKVWSDGVFQATPHRVVNTYGAERYSIPFFMTPDYDAELKPIVKNPTPSNAPEFATSIPIVNNKTCGEHLTALYDRIYPVAAK